MPPDGSRHVHAEEEVTSAYRTMVTCITDIPSFPGEYPWQEGRKCMFLELTPLVQWSPQLINLETIRQIEPLKSNQVNFTRIHFADFSTTLDVSENYEEVKIMPTQARLMLEAVERSDSAHGSPRQEVA